LTNVAMTDEETGARFKRGSVSNDNPTKQIPSTPVNLTQSLLSLCNLKRRAARGGERNK